MADAPTQPVVAPPVIPVTPVKPAVTPPLWRRILIGVAFLAALVGIPFLVHWGIRGKPAQEVAAASTFADPSGVKFQFQKAIDTVTYLDGTTLPVDGLAHRVLTWAEYKAAPEPYKAVEFDAPEVDFPVVVFVNASGFDLTGDPAVIRRAKDGSLLYELKDRPKKPVAAVTVLAGDRYRVVFRDGTEETLADDAFGRTYMGVEPALAVPPPDQLDKMSEAELAKLGLTRMTKEEFAKKSGAPPVAVPAGKTGVRGTVIRVGGMPAVQPASGVQVYILPGAVAPTADAAALAAKAAASATTAADGTYAAAVPPGVYTVVAVRDGKPLGNAVNQAKWPTVTVGETWAEYEFRLPAQ